MSKIAGFMIGVILFSLIVVGGGQFINNFKVQYDLKVEEGWEAPYDYLGNMTSAGRDMEKILESKDTSWLEGGLSMGWSVVKNALGIPKFMKGVMTEAADRLNLPHWFEKYIGTIMVIILLMVIVAALLRWYI